MTVKLKRAEFRAWLESKPKREVVGQANDCFHCPIASYLNELTEGERFVKVDPKHYDVHPAPTRRLASWAQKFVHRVDARHSSITAKRALKIMDEVTNHV